MFKKKIRNFFFLTLIGGSIFFLSTKTILAGVEEKTYFISLNFQKIWKDFFSNLFSSQDVYQEKYYQLLQELAKLKLSLKNIKEVEIIENQGKYLPRIEKVKVLKTDSFGYIYVTNFPEIEDGLIVVDSNWVLVGKVFKILKNYSLVESLAVPNLEFNVTNIEGKLLGLAKTISNGYLEINFVDPEMKVNVGDLVLTGKGIYPSGFIIGSISKIYKKQYNQTIIAQTSFDFESSELFVIRK